MFKFLRGFLILFTLLIANANGAIQFSITEGNDNAKPIGVAPFQWNGYGLPPDDISGIIASDLLNSGIFKPIPSQNIPQIAYSADEINPADWIALGVDSVIVGKIEETINKRYIISFQLVDIQSNPRRILAQNQYSIAPKDLRYGAHKISDVIFQQLTGIRGAFSTKIAYIVVTSTNNKNLYELRVSDYDGYNQRLLHRSRQPLMSPTWSPDLSKLVFVTFESGRAILVIKDLATGKVDQLASYVGHNGAPAYSPDGKKLVFASSRTGTLNLYMMDLQTRKVKQITFEKSNNTEPSWFPDSDKLLFTSDRAGRPQLFTMSVSSGKVKQLTATNQNQNGKVSPDGKFIVMISTIGNKQQLSKYNIKRDYYTTLTSTFLDEAPSISPNSAMVIYNSTKGLSNILNLISADDKFKAELPITSGSAKYPSWSPFIK